MGCGRYWCMWVLWIRWWSVVKIQDMVYSVMLDFYPAGGFHINWVRVEVFKSYGVALSYK